jgi:hypothetical protein
MTQTKMGSLRHQLDVLFFATGQWDRIVPLHPLLISSCELLKSAPNQSRIH